MRISASRFDKPGGISRYITDNVGPVIVECRAQMSRADHSESQMDSRTKAGNREETKRQTEEIVNAQQF